MLENVKILSNEKLGFNENNMESLDWQRFELLAKYIVDDIMTCKYLNMSEIGLMAIARGGLTLTSFVSHHIDKRDISFMQVKMTNSDIPYDYGATEIVLSAFSEAFDNFLILDDIIYHGNTIDIVKKEFKRRGKRIVSIYSLSIDESYENKDLKIPISSASIVKNDSWVKFPWEQQ